MYFLANTVYLWQLLVYLGSNTMVFVLNKVVFGGTYNGILGKSRVFGGQVVWYFGQIGWSFEGDTVICGANTVVFWKNIVVLWANTVVFGTNIVVFGYLGICRKYSGSWCKYIYIWANIVVFGLNTVVFWVKYNYN